jgi:hypothetical protein
MSEHRSGRFRHTQTPEPCGSAPARTRLAEPFERFPAEIGQSLQVHTPGVRHFSHDSQSFLDPLACGAALSTGNVMQAGRELEENTKQRHLIANGLEVQLLEQIARLEPVRSASGERWSSPAAS